MLTTSLAQSDTERQARQALCDLMLAFGLTETCLTNMAGIPRCRAVVREMAQLMADQKTKTDRIRRIANPDPAGLINTHRTIR